MNDEESTHYPRTIRVAARGIAGNKNKIHKDGAIAGRGGKNKGKNTQRTRHPGKKKFLDELWV